MLPDGALPKSIFVLGSLALYNAFQCFIPSMRLTPRIYARARDEVSPLMSRMMGTWTLTSAMIRIYASYNINNAPVYQLCMISFMIAFLSFGLEVFVYKTAPLSSPGVYPAMIMSSVMFSWMYSSYSEYLVKVVI
jgi:hypothetical protein